MSPESLDELAAEIGEATGVCQKVVSLDLCSGGCINDAAIVKTDQQKSWFVKFNSDAPDGMFSAEAQGLQTLEATNTIRVPEVITQGMLSSGQAFLVLEAIPLGRGARERSSEFYETFGQQLADMHRQGTSSKFGFDADNWLGSSVQLNPWLADWTEFWITARLTPQLKMARDNGVSNRKLDQLGNRLLNRLDQILKKDLEPPSLIHGDLWSGNLLSDENGQPVIFDPACYYAHREAEFGMTKLFGGFPAEFYNAYQETWPLAEGWETRVEIYTLYHLLNHLNLFGGSYLSGCVEILERYA